MEMHVNRPESVSYRTVRGCRPCGRRTRQLVRLYEWYEPLARCCRCGLDPRSTRKTTEPERARQLTAEWRQSRSRAQAVQKLIRMMKGMV